MADPFCYLRLRAADSDGHAGLAEALRRDCVPRWREDGIVCWGIWQGLFGIGSNELLVMAAAAEPAAGAALTAAPLPQGARLVDRLLLSSTVRPADPAPLTRDGLYVFRFFEVAGCHGDEVVALSSQAWRTFETSERYRSRPEGLFRPVDAEADTVSRMLLVTWYDGFESWSASRRPAPEAAAAFRRRRELTTGTVAYAARLLEPPG